MLLDESQDLCLAAFNNDTLKVSSLLSDGISPNELAYWSKPLAEDQAYQALPLHLATIQAHKETMKLLLDAGADVGAIDGKGRSALICAIYGELDTLTITQSNYTYLTAASDAHTDIVRMLLAHLRSHNNYSLVVDAPQHGEYLKGITPLCLAAYLGKVDIVDALLKGGANVDAIDKNGATALMYAARDGHKMVVTALLAHKASKITVDINGWNALQYAQGYPEIQAMLEEEKSPVEVMRELSEKYPEFYKSLSGYLTQSQGSKESQIKILIAIKNYDVGALNALLQQNVEVNFVDTASGLTPLQYSTRIRPLNVELVQMLLPNSAADARNVRSGKTALHYVLRAASPNNFDAVIAIMKLLFEHKANPNIIDFEGNYPVHFAVTAGNLEILRLLESHHADFSVKNKDGEALITLAQTQEVTDFLAAVVDNKTAANDSTGFRDMSPTASGRSRDIFNASSMVLESVGKIKRQSMMDLSKREDDLRAAPKLMDVAEDFTSVEQVNEKSKLVEAKETQTDEAEIHRAVPREGQQQPDERVVLDVPPELVDLPVVPERNAESHDIISPRQSELEEQLAEALHFTELVTKRNDFLEAKVLETEQELNVAQLACKSFEGSFDGLKAARDGALGELEEAKKALVAKDARIAGLEQKLAVQAAFDIPAIQVTKAMVIEEPIQQRNAAGLPKAAEATDVLYAAEYVVVEERALGAVEDGEEEKFSTPRQSYMPGFHSNGLNLAEHDFGKKLSLNLTLLQASKTEVSNDLKDTQTHLKRLSVWKDKRKTFVPELATVVTAADGGEEEELLRDAERLKNQQAEIESQIAQIECLMKSDTAPKNARPPVPEKDEFVTLDELLAQLSTQAAQVPRFDADNKREIKKDFRVSTLLQSDPTEFDLDSSVLGSLLSAAQTRINQLKLTLSSVRAGKECVQAELEACVEKLSQVYGELKATEKVVEEQAARGESNTMEFSAKLEAAERKLSDTVSERLMEVAGLEKVLALVRGDAGLVGVCNGAVESVDAAFKDKAGLVGEVMPKRVSTPVLVDNDHQAFLENVGYIGKCVAGSTAQVEGIAKVLRLMREENRKYVKEIYKIKNAAMVSNFIKDVKEADAEVEMNVPPASFADTLDRSEYTGNTSVTDVLDSIDLLKGEIVALEAAEPVDGGAIANKQVELKLLSHTLLDAIKASSAKPSVGDNSVFNMASTARVGGMVGAADVYYDVPQTKRKQLGSTRREGMMLMPESGAIHSADVEEDVHKENRTPLSRSRTSSNHGNEGSLMTRLKRVRGLMTINLLLDEQ